MLTPNVVHGDDNRQTFTRSERPSSNDLGRPIKIRLAGGKLDQQSVNWTMTPTPLSVDDSNPFRTFVPVLNSPNPGMWSRTHMKRLQRTNKFR